MLQVKSSRAVELEYLFVSFVVLWSCSSIFDSVPCKGSSVCKRIIFLSSFIPVHFLLKGHDKLRRNIEEHQCPARMCLGQQGISNHFILHGLAAIRSALMTTAKQLSPLTNCDVEFSYGAGQIDPSKAVNPGLVYDAGENDYIRFLCGQGYSSRTLQLITGDNSSCSETQTTYGTTRDLNYPSFALQVPTLL